MTTEGLSKEEIWEAVNTLYPVTGMRFYGRAVEIIRRAPKERPAQLVTNRGKITRLSRKSLSRLAFVVSATEVKFTSILTLTYLEIEVEGRQVKRHLNSILTAIRKRFAGVEYLWFLEFQRRGAPHFHILTAVRPTAEDRLWIGRRWAKLVANGNEKVERVNGHEKSWEVVRRPDGAKRYALKYALKPHQKFVPKEYQNVGRFWGHSRSVRPVSSGEVTGLTEAEIRNLLRPARTGLDDAMPLFLPKYVFLD